LLIEQNKSEYKVFETMRKYMAYYAHNYEIQHEK